MEIEIKMKLLTFNYQNMNFEVTRGHSRSKIPTYAENGQILIRIERSEENYQNDAFP